MAIVRSGLRNCGKAVQRLIQRRREGWAYVPSPGHRSHHGPPEIGLTSLQSLLILDELRAFYC